MKVSIVIPVYNAQKYLKECIESALNQTYKDIEIIAVNDGSTDGSIDILNQYSDQIKIISKENGGTATALNLGIDNMSGEWFKWLSADDVLYPNAVEDLITYNEKINKNSTASTIVFMGNDMIVDGIDETIKTMYYDCNSLSTFEQGVRLLDHFFGSFATNIIHKSIFNKAGKFSERWNTTEDHEMLMRLCVIYNYRFHCVPKCIYSYRYHASQLSTNKSVTNKNKISITNSILDKLSHNDRKKYGDALKEYQQNKKYRTGVWCYVNSHRYMSDMNLESRYRKQKNSLLRFISNFMNKHIFLRIIWWCVKDSNSQYFKGWFWARKNKHTQDISKCRKKSYYDYVLIQNDA